MREIIAAGFVSIDGVMQAPGGPQEDPTGGFAHGGWVAGFWDEGVGAAMDEQFSKPLDLLLGRRTYDIFAAHWPHVPRDPAHSAFDALNLNIANMFDRITKYVATHRPEGLTWQNSEGLGPDPIARLREIKAQDGPPLLTQGSTELLHLLFAHDLVDEIRLCTFPLVLGRGKRMFPLDGPGTTFAVSDQKTTPNGAILATYRRAGAVRTGDFGMEQPTEAELERRRNLT
jgi:dihydrofolate reductase